ncbi:hypothetical protein [Derxia gummosa]|uniref:Uncharacterized protein n=1 Tax=Derxia gummosa DSM 723 TaxID=1121388 RepID=A0A8B6X4D5_9BURK|nr:hypothetical protein [Derxia gummosa]
MPLPGQDPMSIAIAAMNEARNGGDFNALFRGRKLAFKLTSLRDSVCDLREAANDAATNVGAVLVPGSNQVVDALLGLARLIRDGGKAMMAGLKSAFHKLLDVFDELRTALADAFQPLLGVMNMAIDALVNLLFDLLPNVFIEFVKGIVAAVLPFVGQIKAVGGMLLAVGGLVRNAIERRQLVKSAAALDLNNRFSSAARGSIMTMIDDELRRAAADAAIETVNAGSSVAGLVFTGNVAGMVSGIATSVAKLCIKVGVLVSDLLKMRRGNELLDRMAADPRHDVNPAALFAAAPILGCHYLVSATQSSLIANTGFSTSFRTRITTSSQAWLAAYQAKAAQLTPLRTKAFELVRASRMELTAESRFGISLDISLVDEAKDAITGAIGDAVTGRAGAAVMARMA